MTLKRAMCGLLGVSFAVGLTCLWLFAPLAPDLAYTSDAADYFGVTQYLLQSGAYSLDGTTPYAEREPGYSLFQAVIFGLTGSTAPLVLYLAQLLALLAATAVWILALQPYAGARVAWLSGALLLGIPGVYHATLVPYREGLVLAVGLGVTASVLYAVRRNSVRAHVVGGGLLGFISLLYLPYLFLPHSLCAGLALCGRFRKHAVWFVLIPTLAVALWIGRNAVSLGNPSLSEGFRSAAILYTRAEQAETIHGLEPLWCLTAEYITRNWEGRSPNCSLNAVIARKWPGRVPTPEDDAIRRESVSRIVTHLPDFVWFSLFEVLEYHLPYVNGWGRTYNILESLMMAAIYAGCALALLRVRHWPWWLWLHVGTAAYGVVMFALTDATPRYHIPLLYCYTLLSAVGYDSFMSTLSTWCKRL